MGNRNAGDDLSNYRNGYPGQVDDLSLNDNYKFYNGEIESVPDGDFIDNIHLKWKGKYQKLEVHHGYIQWLFPIREHGMNSESQPLQAHEIEKMKEKPEIIERILRSYDLILHFYGLVVADKTTGVLQRGDNWENQFYNLNTHSHNFLRITRILKCLGEFGYEHYKKPFLELFINEIWVNKTLKACASSCRNYWIGTLKSDEDRKELLDRIQVFYPDEIPARARSLSDDDEDNDETFGKGHSGEDAKKAEEDKPNDL
jgi:hypothetical protein